MADKPTSRSKTTARPKNRERVSELKMFVLLYASIFLALAGGIHSSPVARNFSFEEGSEMQFVSVRFGRDVSINCRTNDPSANVTLYAENYGKPEVVTMEQGRFSRDGAIFTIHNAIVSSGGKYICRAEAKDGQTITRDVRVAIDSAVAAITIIPFVAKKILTGSSTSYICEGTMGTLRWYKIEIIGSDSKEIRKIPMPFTSGVTVTSSRGSGRIVKSELRFTNASHVHSGVYRCELSYDDKLLDRSVALDVKDREVPLITEYSSSAVTVNSGNRIKLVCVPSIGFPHPTITWKKDGKEIRVQCVQHSECAKTERYILWSKGLIIEKARYPDDDGVFTCEAKNSVGSDKKDFVITIPTAPLLDKSDSVMRKFAWTPSQTTPIKIPCTLEQGSPRPTFSWFFKFCWKFGIYAGLSCSKWESTTQKGIFQVSTPANTPSPVSYLIIKMNGQVMLPQIVKFNCTVNNAKGSDSMVFDLHEGKQSGY